MQAFLNRSQLRKKHLLNEDVAIQLALPANDYYKLLNKRQKPVQVFLKITKSILAKLFKINA